MNFIEEFEARGFFYQCSDKENLTKLMIEKSVACYIGFDCTATSLHVGSLMQMMIFRLMQRHGHRPIVIIGGATSKIGDPSFKDEARKMLDDETLQKNIEGIKATISKFIKFDNSANGALMINNEEWLADIKYLDLLRDIGPHFSVNRMLAFDSVKLRLDREQSLSFLEFNYMILQAYDFTELYKRYNCRVQIGGSDQWGNIINGVELNRRLGKKEELYALTTPLITTASGVKMGKTVSGAIWLSEDKLPVYDYYQFWRNTEDLDVIKFMKLFTELPLKEIEAYSKLKGAEINEAKKILAFEATKICHGEENAKKAEETARMTFEQGALGADLPEFLMEKIELEKGIPLYSLIHKAGLCTSGGEAKRLIQGGGAKVNDETISNPMELISLTHLNNNVIKLSMGKKKHLVIRLS